MRFDGGAIDQNLRGRSVGLRERVENVRPHAFLRPSNKAVVERLPRPVFRRRIDPATTRLQHLHDAADHAPIIDARFATRVRRQMWLDLRKLRIRQPELIAIHPRSPSGSRESQPADHANTFMGPDPNVANDVRKSSLYLGGRDCFLGFPDSAP